MASEAQTGEALARIATIAEAVVTQFGSDAIHVAQQQAESASGEAADRWYAIMRHLQAQGLGAKAT